jgi:hypothetical protein
MTYVPQYTDSAYGSFGPNQAAADILTVLPPEYQKSGVADEIARLFDETLWDGNYDAHTDFDESLGVDNLWLIQEDEYDQSMDDDDKPDFDTQFGYAAGHYVFPA